MSRATERYLTVKQLAALLDTTVDAIYHMNSRGTGPRIMRPSGSKRGSVRYRLADVERWEKTRLEPAASP